MEAQSYPVASVAVADMSRATAPFPPSYPQNAVVLTEASHSHQQGQELPQRALQQQQQQQTQLPQTTQYQPPPLEQPQAKVQSATTTASAPSLLVASRFPSVVSQCHACARTNVRTRICTSPGILTWVAVGAMAVVFWPLCWIPLVTDTAKHTTHFCSYCSAEVGSVPPFQDCCVKHR